MDAISSFIIENLQANSPSAIIARGFVWLALVTIFAIGTAQGKTYARIKSEAGLFLLFIILTTIAIYVSFGFWPTFTSVDPTSGLLEPAVRLVEVGGNHQWQSTASYFQQNVSQS